ncbi:MAG: glycerol kinase, partial [Gammaproteobacteria bacterium]|nr:glycerol kinase [Gammaproteobacteria bacterium]
MKSLAIDQGTTSTRALLVDEQGQCTTLRTVTHRQFYPRSGWVEHDPEELLHNIQTCLDAAESTSGIGAVGIANQGESCLAWDSQTGKAIYPVIVWQDDRTRDEITELAKRGAEA